MLRNVPNQIVQSPARLGLPNPNSPRLQTPTTPSKFLSQNSESHYPYQQSILSTTATISPTLLPLLPPLSRAQSLLIQIASLASRLFEVSPNRPHWLSAFHGSLPSFLSAQAQAQAQARTLTPIPLDSTPSTKEIVSHFTTLQTQLFEAVAELQEILDLHDSKQKVAREIQSKDSAILAFANKLREAEQVLDGLVDDYSDYRSQNRSKSYNNEENPTTTRIKISDIISYAHKISYTTFAPPEFGAGQAPLRGALPPAPQEEQMRASQLYGFADLDVGIPKKVEDNGIAIQPFIEPPVTQVSSPLVNPVIPPNFVIPSELDLPDGLPSPPPMPPGWKAGDEIPLWSIPPPAKKQPSRPVPAPGVLKETKPTKVRHVELDIVGSSDYSSNEASSDGEESSSDSED